MEAGRKAAPAGKKRALKKSPSPEAKQAMKALTTDEGRTSGDGVMKKMEKKNTTKTDKKNCDAKESLQEDTNYTARSRDQGTVEDSQTSVQREAGDGPDLKVKLCDLFRRMSSTRMARDLTDLDYDPARDPVRALGGGKVESALEIVEIVRHREEGEEGEEEDSGPALQEELRDDDVMGENLHQSAIDKCLVWLHAHWEC